VAARGAAGEHGTAMDASTELPAPKRSRRALLWTSTTYFGEGLPWSALHQMGTEFLNTAKASSTMVSATSYFHLAVTFKFLLSPIVDAIGTKRAWMLGLQLALGGGMIAVGAAVTASSAPHFWPFWVVGGLFAILHSMHDIACDGFYLQALTKHDQALYSGTRIAAYRMALLVGSSWLVVLAASAGWMRGFTVAGALMIVVAIVNTFATPRITAPIEGDAPPHAAVRSKREAFVEAYRGFVRQPQAALVIAFMLVYRLGDVMMFNNARQLLRDIGISLKERGYIGTPSMIASILGAVVGGGVIARLGLRRTLVPILYLQNLAIPIYIGLAVWKPSFSVVVACVLVEQFVAGMGSTGFSVFVMNRARGAFATSYYAFGTAVVALASTFAGNAAGWLDDRVGHAWLFTIAFFASVPSLVLVWFVPKDPAEAVATAPRERAIAEEPREA
jgi:PAT family beta-lactamase induction signal transducer AmpG